MKIFVIFLLIYAAQNHAETQNELNLMKYVCKVTENIINSDSDTKDVTIGHWNSKLSPEFFSSVVECVSRHTMVITSDFKVKIQHKNLRRAQVIIIISDVDIPQAFINRLMPVLQTPTMDHMAKVIFVSSDDSLMTRSVVQLFYSWGFYDFIVTFPDENQVFTEIRDISFKGFVLENNSDPGTLYFDKLKDMKGTTYRIIVFGDVFKAEVESGSVKVPMASFIETVAKKQNARIKYFNHHIGEEYFRCYDSRCMDLLLNPMAFSGGEHPKLLTYEEVGHCALIPRPKSNLFKLILFRPFGWTIWTAFFGSLIASALAWRLFKDRGATDSFWKVLFGILAYFLGQSISFRKNHLVLVILLQMFIFMTIILSSLYTGELTAFMIEPAEEQKLRTFDELFESDYNFMVDAKFDQRMKSNEGYAKIKSRVEVGIGQRNLLETKRMAEEGLAIVVFCNVAKNALKREQYSNFYYLLDQWILKDYVQLDASFLNPYVERLQLYMDWSFEADLPQAWKLFLMENITKVNEDAGGQFLDLGDMGQVFLILAIGLMIAVIAFFVELLYHKQGENLHMQWVYMKDEIYLRRLRRRNLRRRRRLRRVQPINI